MSGRKTLVAFSDMYYFGYLCLVEHKDYSFGQKTE